MPWIEVTIVRFVEEHQPGIVECVFEDASGQAHGIVDKCWMLTEQSLWSDSAYPVQGSVQCRVLKLRKDHLDRKLALITIAEPDHLETTEDKTEFILFASKVSDEPPA